ncbi:MAG: hypothetical protein A2381_13240 [Bdellovibrionales bacterium RIFOXYB1_FULL_37_110]|nr:MAG: hypothetical protein A2181_02565 [Bdellovibrionales bacterium RIFOXYA1_FULL_38_20]OFZ51667.1 MAG: hypothetical protein A2417_12900 [Bdellovibrionales bacterium RIFOXYC1_FULL_37_79]OFZ60494.1 MAG: hypothetical protein A2381_13240 [Bdellovibrionales bacterium RIFOXYB1_FULL_37_110]OFZ65068.1 MAG: hypothetical protein A2577_09505 [Bdellovibrionales bacterium RIFOXYD1_FULL_36_51]
MKSLVTLLVCLSFIQNLLALDVGDGSLGACTEASLVANNSGPYNCTSLTIGAAFNFTGDAGVTAPVVIKVTGDVIINNVLSVNGANGGVGNNDDGIADQVIGGIPGRGGFAGGSTGVDSTTPGQNGNDGGYGGAGFGGTKGSEGGLGWAAGGGGGGGRFGGAAIAGNNGITSGDIGTSIGLGGAAGLSTYAPESNFKILLVGGSGGGAGGPSADSSDPYDMSGSGGGGGGALRIMAGGDITINSSIRANGGHGGAGFEYSGGGGGGSGGAIFLESLGDVIVAGSIIATGGSGGAGAPTIGTTVSDGGDGSVGRIRIDDRDGNWSGAGSVTPAAYEAVVDSDSGVVTQIDSGISCGSIALVDDKQNIFFTLLLGIVAVSFVMGFLRKLKFIFKQ